MFLQLHNVHRGFSNIRLLKAKEIEQKTDVTKNEQKHSNTNKRIIDLANELHNTKSIISLFGLIAARKKEFKQIPTPIELTPETTLQETVAEKVQEIAKPRQPEEWKEYPKADAAPDFSFKAAEVNFTGLNLSDEEKIAVQEKAMAKYREAMISMDHSIADASLDMVRDKQGNPELHETLSKFSQRYLDIYEAYVSVLQDEKQPFFSADVGFAKSFGFSHEDIKTFIEPAKWYQGLCSELCNNINNANPNYAKKVNGFINYLSQNHFRFGSLKELKQQNDALVCGTEISQLELFNGLKDPKISQALKDFCAQINANKNEGTKIKNLGKNFGNNGSGIDVIENLKQELAEVDLANTFEHVDTETAVCTELKCRIGTGEKEPGYLSDPKDMIDIVRGLRDHQDAASLMRHKLYFIYKSKGIANEIVGSPSMVEKVNAKLADKGWQLDADVCEYLYTESPKSPIFKLGNYSSENSRGKVRERATPEQTKLNAAKYQRTFADGERLAAKGPELTLDEMNAPLPIKMTEEEIKTYLSNFGSSANAEMNKNFERYSINEGKTLTDDDKKLPESILEYAKSTTMQPWIPGKFFFNLTDPSTSDSPYLKAVDALGLPQQAGISGSTDQTLTMAGVVGITSVEEIKRLRLMYLGWMTSNDDHSVDEIMTSAKSFGVPYTPSPDYYKNIYAENPAFVDMIAAEQTRRGYALPDHYLSKEYAAETLASYRAEKETLVSSRKEKEALQNKAVTDKLAANELFMKAVIAKPEKQAMDLFQNQAWSPFLNKLNTPKKVAANNGKVKFTYNPETKSMEPHARADVPFYTGTKKTSVTLLPTNGKVLPYQWEQDESIGLLFDREKSPFKDNYIFTADALTDNKWWRRFYTENEMSKPDFPQKLDLAAREIQSRDALGKKQSFDHLRVSNLQELISKIESVGKFTPHNEVLASVNKSGIEGIFALNKQVDNNPEGAEMYTRLKGITNKYALKLNEGVDVPLFVIDQARDKGLALYSFEDQANDVRLLKENKNGAFDAVVAYVAEKSKDDKIAIASALSSQLAQLELYLA